MFIAALLTIVKTQKQPKCLSMYMAHTYNVYGTYIPWNNVQP